MIVRYTHFSSSNDYVSVFLLTLLVVGSADQQCNDNRGVPPPVSSCDTTEDYDFIVVGGGTGGAIAAARLANAGYEVLLIESGPRFYDNSTKSLKAIFPILFGLELESVDQAILALEQVLSGFIPIHSSLADDLDWLGRTLNDTLSKTLNSLLPKAKKDGLLGGLLGSVGNLLGATGAGSTGSSTGSGTTGTTGTTGSTGSTTSSNTPQARDLLQSLVNLLKTVTNGAVDGVATLLPNMQQCPLFGPYISMSEASHYYVTTPQLFSQKREIDYPRGNLLGGSSGVNQMVFCRGSRRDYDQWESEFELEGWGYDDVFKYFKVYENNQDFANTTLHGHEGPINITLGVNHFKNPSASEFVNASKRLGWPEIADGADPTTTYGAGTWQTFVGSNGQRSDSSAYIRLLDKKGLVCWEKPKLGCQGKKLHIWTETFATKVLFDGNRAVGVEYSQGVKSQARTESPYFKKSTNEGSKHHAQFNKWDRVKVQATAERLGCPAAKSLAFDYNRPDEQYVPLRETQYVPKQVRACREVILAAGTVGTAQLLLLSGIGPEEHLQARSIPVIADLPVGRHTQDHQELALMFEMVHPSFDPGFSMLGEVAQGFPEFTKFFKGQRGFLSANHIPAGLDGSSDGPTGSVPTFRLHYLTIGAFENYDFNLAGYDATESFVSRFPRNAIELLAFNNLRFHEAGCELSGNHAYGTIELRSPDPFVPPFVDPRYGSSDEDNLELVKCLKIARQVMNNMTDKYRGKELPPSSYAKTDEELLQFVVNNIWGHHISSSAPMGKCNNKYAVTDHKGKVHKVEGLRVADMSVFPTIPHGNPAGIVMMVAEKISHSILLEYSEDPNNPLWPPVAL